MLSHSGGMRCRWEADCYLSDVLRYNPDTSEWEKTGDLDTPRSDHGASAVKWDVIEPFCN